MTGSVVSVVRRHFFTKPRGCKARSPPVPPRGLSRRASARIAPFSRTLAMRVSRFFLSTLKEAPADAEVISHKLMVRAGLIRRLAAGIYTWLPLGLRVVRKVEAIIREEMNRAGAVEVFMPAVQPAELWQESGRWVKYGPELTHRPDSGQSSAGCTAGMKTSTAPARFISSRMMASTFRTTRSPRGSHV